MEPTHGSHTARVDEEQGIYRGEVHAIMIALADINANTRAIVKALTDDEDGDEEEEADA